MVFGMISAAGPGPLVRLHGRINAAVYKEMLRQHVLPTLRSAANQPAIFMQDNAPCHTGEIYQDLFYRGEPYCNGLAGTKPRHESN